MDVKTEIRIKNLRPGVLFIADAKLRLRPGEEVVVGKLTRQMERCVERGFVAVSGETDSVQKSKSGKSKDKPADQPKDAPRDSGVLDKLAGKLEETK